VTVSIYALLLLPSKSINLLGNLSSTRHRQKSLCAPVCRLNERVRRIVDDLWQWQVFNKALLVLFEEGISQPAVQVDLLPSSAGLYNHQDAHLDGPCFDQIAKELVAQFVRTVHTHVGFCLLQM
jgi:hypothetical protein